MPILVPSNLQGNYPVAVRGGGGYGAPNAALAAMMGGSRDDSSGLLMALLNYAQNRDNSATAASQFQASLDQRKDEFAAQLEQMRRQLDMTQDQFQKTLASRNSEFAETMRLKQEELGITREELRGRMEYLGKQLAESNAARLASDKRYEDAFGLQKQQFELLKKDSEISKAKQLINEFAIPETQEKKDAILAGVGVEQAKANIEDKRAMQKAAASTLPGERAVERALSNVGTIKMSDRDLAIEQVGTKDLGSAIDSYVNSVMNSVYRDDGHGHISVDPIAAEAALPKLQAARDQLAAAPAQGHGVSSGLRSLFTGEKAPSVYWKEGKVDQLDQQISTLSKIADPARADVRNMNIAEDARRQVTDLNKQVSDARRATAQAIVGGQDMQGIMGAGMKAFTGFRDPVGSGGPYDPTWGSATDAYTGASDWAIPLGWR